MQGKFITFEGGEGSGKTTQIELLKQYLEREGYSCVVGREPGGTQASEEIRKILLDEQFKGQITPEAETLLFEAARAIYTESFIRPNIEEGRIVISDRFYDSTSIYQGIGRGINADLIGVLNSFATRGLIPDLTILLDVPEELMESTLAKAIQSSGGADRLEGERIEFHKAVYRGFRDLAKKTERIKVVKYRENGVEEVHREIIRYVQPLLNGKRA